MIQGSKLSASAPNHLLGNIEPNTLEVMGAQLETIELPLGMVLYDAGDRIEYLYFPQSAVLSLIAVLADGRTAEMAVIGRQGTLGLIEALGDGISQGRCVVQASGTVSRIRAEHFQRHMENSPHFRHLMLRYLQFLFMQALQNGVCNAVHPVEARCCRMILTMRDLTGHNRIPITHEFLAGMLGVQRPAVTTVTRHLQDSDLVKQGRGVITVIDGTQIEGMACECYRTIRHSFERLLPRLQDPR